MSDRISYEERYKRYADAVESALPKCLDMPLYCETRPLMDAMKYSLLAGGKRVRPVILLAFADACGGDLEHAMPFACAIEMIHTYSLIHDDLPCMDDDDTRRGKPSNHRKHGEAMALLAGDCLLTMAFQVMLGLGGGADAGRAVKAAHQIAYGAGIRGMAGGQAIDIQKAPGNLSKDELTDRLTDVNELKTCGLLIAAAEAGCILAGADDSLVNAAFEYGCNLGMAFQLIDDILDAEGDPEVTGKPVGSDAKLNKPTYMSLLGPDECRALARDYTEKAAEALAPFGANGDFQRELARRLLSRVS